MISQKTILMVVDSCYPNLSMNGVIAKNIADVLSENNRVLIISLRRGTDDAKEMFGEEIIYIKGFHYYEAIFTGRSDKATNSIEKNFFNILNYLTRIVSISFRIVSKSGLNNHLSEKFREKMEKKLLEEKIDYVICVSVPFESAVAMVDLSDRYRNTKFILYQVDDFVTALDANYPVILLKRREKARIKMVHKFESTLYKYRILESAYQKEKKYINQVNVKPTGFPLLKDNSRTCSKNMKKMEINLTYTGSLVHGVRPVDDALCILKKVREKVRLTVDIYHRGNCGGVINQFINAGNSFVTNHGSVSTDRAYEAMVNADVLFAISTRAGDQISGKTFDYISTGKPVIFFYYMDNDMNLSIYKRYDLFLGIKLEENKTYDNVEQIVNFLNGRGKRKLSFSEIVEKYSEYKPDVVVEELFGE